MPRVLRWREPQMESIRRLRECVEYRTHRIPVRYREQGKVTPTACECPTLTYRRLHCTGIS